MEYEAMTVKAGDPVTFTYSPEWHDVATVPTLEAFDACDMSGMTSYVDFSNPPRAQMPGVAVSTNDNGEAVVNVTFTYSPVWHDVATVPTLEAFDACDMSGVTS